MHGGTIVSMEGLILGITTKEYTKRRKKELDSMETTISI